jgi:predicted transcriptional regulator
MAPPTSEDFANVLLKRYECLHALVEHPQPKRELVDTLDIPRSTLDNIVRQLEQTGLVRYFDGVWQPTLSGQRALRVHETYLSEIDDLVHSTPVLTTLAPNSGVTWEFIDHADVYETNPNVQNDVLIRLLDYAEAATDIRVATPRIVAGFGDEFYRSGTTGRDATFEIIAPSEIHEWIHKRHSKTATDLLNDPNVNMFRASIPFSFSLSIFDDTHAGITVFAEQGIAGLIVNDTDDALTWAEEQYNNVKKDAEQIFTRGGSSRLSGNN